MLTVEDTMVNRDKTNELKRVLEKVFNERCGLPVEVAFQYIPPKENDRRKQIELKLEREAQAIYWQNHKDELENVSGGENISQTVAKSDNGEKKLIIVMLLLWIFLCRRQLHGTLLWIRQLPEMFLAMMRLFLLYQMA